MTTGARLLELALPHVGEAYVNVQVPKDNANWKGPWDCAEFMSWLVFQASGILYGCISNAAKPAVADAYTGAWKRDSLALGIRISVAQAAATVGAMVLRYPPHDGAMGHIALSDGTGGTVEAMGTNDGVARGRIAGRRWDTGVLIPGIQYDAPLAKVPLGPMPVVLHAGSQDEIRAAVLALQMALVAEGFDPGPVDGLYGPKTSAAVAGYQAAHGLVVDGEAGPATRAALGI